MKPERLVGAGEKWEEVSVATHPLERGRWVATVAEIRDNATGIVREHQDDTILEDGCAEPSSFNWEEGNYSCDCNRHLFFARAAGENEGFDNVCSEGRYAVRVRNKMIGRVFYSEFLEL